MAELYNSKGILKPIFSVAINLFDQGLESHKKESHLIKSRERLGVENEFSKMALFFVAKEAKL